MSFSVRAKHRPIHFYQDETYYFVTLRTIDRIRYFRDDSISAVVRDVNSISAAVRRGDTISGVVPNTISGVILDNTRNGVAADNSRNAVRGGVVRKRVVSNVIQKAIDRFKVRNPAHKNW